MRWLLILLVLNAFSGGALASPGRSAYALRFTARQTWLDRFDPDRDEIIGRRPLKENCGYNNFVVDETGGCYLAQYRYGGSLYGRRVDHYDPERARLSTFLKLGNCFGPRYLVLTKDQLIVEVRGNDDSRLFSGLIFIDRRQRRITRRLFIRENDPALSQANLNELYYDGGRYLLCSTFYCARDPNGTLEAAALPEDGHGDILIIDVVARALLGRIIVPRQYFPVDGVCLIGDKVYVAALEKGRRASSGSAPANQELLVFSLASRKLLKTIPVAPFPYKLAADPSVGKLYVQHLYGSTVEVLSTVNDRIIKRLEIPAVLMAAVVKPGKLYVSTGDMLWEKRPVKAGLLIIDTRTDKIIKRFDGEYKGISEKSFVE
ncbi:MAG: hypothetical protein MUC35_01830 [Candidatus Margulisbacteria bacterium]|nr:hypothetical protein [Candidatus Margulisiibacteriota bacterium]